MYGIDTMTQTSLNSISTKNSEKAIQQYSQMIGLASAREPFGFGYNYSISKYNIPWFVFVIDAVLILFAVLLNIKKSRIYKLGSEENKMSMINE